MQQTKHLIKASILVAASISSLSAFGQDSYEMPELHERFTKILDIRTQQLTNYLNFRGSPLQPLVLARVTERNAKAAPDSGILYEDLWYRNDQPVGAKRHGPLKLTLPEDIAIRVSHSSSSPQPAEIAASVNAAIRLYVDLYKYSTTAQAIIVPESSMTRYVEAMNKFGFYPADDPPPDTPIYSSIVLKLQSEPSGREQLLLFTGQEY